jgi:hypothetical protein
MQNLKITIPGKYWDTQLYEGRLYLFDRDAGLQVLNWDLIVDEWKIPDHLRVALECAFRRSDYLYHSDFRLLLHDPEIRNLIRNKFEQLAELNLDLSASRLSKVIIGKQDVPFPFPHADSTVYMRSLYSAGQSGIYRATCNKRTKRPISTRPERRWDGPAVSIAASYGCMAIAAADEGLFELSLSSHDFPRKDARRLATKNCVGCNWALYSIYGSSHLSGGFMAEFQKEQVGRNEPVRKFRDVVGEGEIFASKGYSWGVHDKLYQATSSEVRVVRYLPWRERRFQWLGAIEVPPDLGGVVSASAALFGTVIEFDEGILVEASDGGTYKLDGEPIRWRTFPRSKHYENQLHVIYEDHLEIYSFNHDYFVDQETKIAGSTHFDFGGKRGGWQPQAPPTSELFE